jgi:AcrR family transcriptional regulator
MFSCPNTRKLGRPSRDEAERISDHVLDTAARLFAERGYAATSIAAIATAARVGKHTIYRRYPDKSDLFRAVVHRLADRILTGEVDGQTDPGSHLDQLHALVHRAAMAAVAPDMLSIYQLTVSEARQFPELASIVMRVEGDRLIGRLAELIAGAQADGALAPGDPTFVARFLIEGVTSYLFHHCLAGQPFTHVEVRDHVEQSWQLFLHGAAGRA